MKSQKTFTVIIVILLVVPVALAVFARVSGRFDSWFYNDSYADLSPGVLAFMRFITTLNNTATVCAICLALIAIPQTRRTVALPVSVAAILSAALNTLVKVVVARARPGVLPLVEASGYSFPSGHAMSAATLYTMLLLLTYYYVKNPRRRHAAALACYAMVLLVGYSRVYLGVHFVSDVLAGYALGALVAYLVFRWWKHQGTPSSPPEGPGENAT